MLTVIVRVKLLPGESRGEQGMRGRDKSQVSVHHIIVLEHGKM